MKLNLFFNKFTAVMCILSIVLLFWPEQTSQSEPLIQKKKEDTSLKDILKQSDAVMQNITTKEEIAKIEKTTLLKNNRKLNAQVNSLSKEVDTIKKNIEALSTSEIITDTVKVDSTVKKKKRNIIQKILNKK